MLANQLLGYNNYSFNLQYQIFNLILLVLSKIFSLISGFLEIKKTYLDNCYGLIGECNNATGLNCEGTIGNKTCQ